MDRDTFPIVKRAHIVPRFFQASWAPDGLITVHENGRATKRSVRKYSGVLPSFYSRTRPTGARIDDIEASLSVAEEAAAPHLKALLGSQPVTLEGKALLAQLFGVQLVRGPHFFAQRERLLRETLRDAPDHQLRKQALRAAGGDGDVVRDQALAVMLDSTSKFMQMLNFAPKLANILANMRWHLLAWDEPALALSDHPIVIWPAGVERAKPFDTPRSGPLQALEIRVPVSPRMAILMNWIDEPDLDARDRSASDRVAREVNAFVISQCASQWMSLPGHDPKFDVGECSPLSRYVDLAYGAPAMQRSRRHGFVEQWYERTKRRTFTQAFEVYDPATTRVTKLVPESSVGP
jgi:hypothetical protein